MGPYEGPGEKRTAEHLAQVLPATWHVIPNRKLPTATSDDVDVFVVGDNKVFVLEEKYWGPTIAIGSHRWSVVKSNNKIDERENPLNSVGAKARKTASWLKAAIADLAQDKTRFVEAGVILSYEDLTLYEKPGYDIPDNIFKLADSASFLTFLDAQNAGSEFKNFRTKVLATILDLETPDLEIQRIGDYKVTLEQSGSDGLRVFEAEHVNTGERAVLKCYDNFYWAQRSGGADEFINRELTALARIAELNRSWRYHPPFQHESKNWTVVPLIRPRGIVNLDDETLNKERAFYRDHALEICTDAFRALAEVHSEQVFHKILCPQRIWIGRGFRVLFNDFYLSHVDQNESVLAATEDSSSSGYRDADAEKSLEFAGAESDVYALAFSLATWITQTNISNKPEVISSLLAAPKNSLLNILAEALSDDIERRPTASEVLVKLSSVGQVTSSPVANSLETKFEAGEVISGRFRLLEKLGRGGMATTWKVADQESDDTIRVLKQLHDSSLYELATKEFANAKQLNYEGCAQVRLINDKPEPGFIISEYVPGTALLVAAKSVDFGIHEARQVAVQALKALDHIHSKGLVHGDISPGNIIVGEDLKTTLIDFGLVTKIGDIQKAGTRSTMPPEVLKSGHKTIQSDLYSLGSTFVQVLLGRAPSNSTDGSNLVLLTEIEKNQWGDEGSALLNVFLRAAHPEIGIRPATAKDMIHQLTKTVPTPIDKLPELGSEPRFNSTVDELRGMYTRSRAGARNSLGVESEFSKNTYIPTKLDTKLTADILAGKLSVVFITGNPGDGKTSFLQQLSQVLLQAGAQGSLDSYGWKLSLDSHVFHAIYDASESFGTETSDALVRSALEPASNDKYTALLAVNDGRLRQFFIDNEEDFPDYSDAVEAFFEGESHSNSKFAIVDLKKRALVGLDGLGVAVEMIESFTSEELWKSCSECFAQKQCPIFKNRTELLGLPRERVAELLLVSHLRRRRRATLRQVRSTLGWLITADLSCTEVHTAVNEKEDLTKSWAALPELVFGGASQDPLIQEWVQLDPANLLYPEAELKIPVVEEEEFFDSPAERYSKYMRSQFFTNTAAEHQATSAYRYFSTFVNMLEAPSNREHMQRLLLGISKIVGAPGFSGEGLAVSYEKGSSGWAVLKPIAEEEFQLTVNNANEEYIEFAPDMLLLTHISGEKLGISLDAAEIILRAAEGEILGGNASEVIQYEIMSFGNKLLRQFSAQILVVEPAGKLNEIDVMEHKIVRKISSAEVKNEL